MWWCVVAYYYYISSSPLSLLFKTPPPNNEKVRPPIYNTYLGFRVLFLYYNSLNFVPKFIFQCLVPWTLVKSHILLCGPSIIRASKHDRLFFLRAYLGQVPGACVKTMLHIYTIPHQSSYSVRLIHTMLSWVVAQRRVLSNAEQHLIWYNCRFLEPSVSIWSQLWLWDNL